MSTQWEAELDPSDLRDFYADFGESDADGNPPVLAVGEKIDTYTVLPSEKAAEFGLEVAQSGAYAHSKTNEDRTIKMWLSVTEANRGACDFDQGIALGVEVSITTDSVPPRIFQRTWTVIVRHQ